jgi:hypothetical protein
MGDVLQFGTSASAESKPDIQTEILARSVIAVEDGATYELALQAHSQRASGLMTPDGATQPDMLFQVKEAVITVVDSGGPIHERSERTLLTTKIAALAGDVYARTLMDRVRMGSAGTSEE